jgi:ABC-type metal ion transport system substrate-binding protein
MKLIKAVVNVKVNPFGNLGSKQGKVAELYTGSQVAICEEKLIKT